MSDDGTAARVAWAQRQRERRSASDIRERCARELHTVAGDDGQCECGVFPVASRQPR